MELLVPSAGKFAFVSAPSRVLGLVIRAVGWLRIETLVQALVSGTDEHGVDR